MGVPVYKPISCSIGLSIQFTIHFIYVVLSQCQSWFTGVPVPQNFIHIILGPDAQELFFITFLLIVVFIITSASAGVMAVVAVHLPADVLKVLLDANLCEALGVLLAGIVEHLALDVNVVRPVLGL